MMWHLSYFDKHWANNWLTQYFLVVLFVAKCKVVLTIEYAINKIWKTTSRETFSCFYIPHIKMIQKLSLTWTWYLTPALVRAATSCAVFWKCTLSERTKYNSVSYSLLSGSLIWFWFVGQSQEVHSQQTQTYFWVLFLSKDFFIFIFMQRKMTEILQRLQVKRWTVPKTTMTC